MKPSLSVLLVCTLILSACATATTNQRVLDMGDESQLQKRSYQSRIFDTNDKAKTLRTVISTLQDLGFVIERADLVLGSVSGTKLDKQNRARITVSVRKKGSDRMLVRANAQFNVTAIDDPKQYQNFFSSLEKALFLTAHAGE
jgi:outer membrane PBP1 activator LpoA protein|tara:strand:+ start:625 stop:1053 length:429 start_codon:yes stop_codon:yes gene_type:complete